MSCIFCSIIAKELPAQIRWEDSQWIVFDDITPKASTHVLLVSKVHVGSLAQATSEHAALLQSAIPTVKIVAATLGLEEAGYKTLINTGRAAGQLVDHLHIHLLSGAIQSSL